MGDKVIPEVAGLQLANNTFSASPPGSLARATNGVISRKGIFEPRRGQAWASTMPAAADIPFSLVEFQTHMLAQYGTSKTDTSQKLGYVSGGAITPYSGTFNPVGDDGVATDYMRVKFCLASMFLHFACTAGPKCLETYNGTPRMAGLSRMPDPFSTNDRPAATGLVLPYNSSVAYRTLLRRATASGVSLLSAPSNRTVATNRSLVPVAGLVRSGGATVTATLFTGTLSTNLHAGDAFTLSPGETNFTAGTYTLASASVSGAGVWTLTWASAGSNVSSTVAQEIDIGTISVAVAAFIPKTAVAGDFVRLYRSVVTSASNIDPTDDLYLCNEVKLAGADIAAGFVGIDDNTPQSVINDPLYTNPSDGDGGGLAGGNFQPPIYGDVANYDGGTWYCNTVGEQSLRLEILGIGSPGGIQDGDTLTIADGTNTSVVTFKTSPSGSTDVQIFSGGTPAQNIAMTSQYFSEIVGPVLLAQGWGVYADTSADGFPGKVRIERWDFGAQFNVKASRATSWTPALSASTPTYSTNGAQANGLWNSKSQQPEAVPPINFRSVGTPNFYARRIFGLRNALIILKEGDGIWSLTGSGGNYNLQQISTANTIAPDCAAVFSDSVWAYTDQGILRISDTGGVQVVSRPIETALNELAIALPSETYASSFAVAYEVERRIMFFLPFEAATAATGSQPLMKAYCYSSATNAWTGPLEFNETPFSGVVSLDKHLWLGAYDGVFSQGRITEERKTGTYLDNAEAQWTNTLTTTSDPLVVVLATAGALQRGSGLSQTVAGTTHQTKIAEVNGDGTYTLAETFPWANGSCTVYDPYPVEAQFLPQSDPATRKSLTRLVSLYKQGGFANFYGSTTIETDEIQATKEIATPFVGYGSTPYGTGPYGNPTPMTVNTNPIEAKWAAAAQFFPGFLLDEVWCRFKMQGMGMTTESLAAPSNRGA